MCSWETEQSDIDHLMDDLRGLIAREFHTDHPMKKSVPVRFQEQQHPYSPGAGCDDPPGVLRSSNAGTEVR